MPSRLCELSPESATGEVNMAIWERLLFKQSSGEESSKDKIQLIVVLYGSIHSKGGIPIAGMVNFPTYIFISSSSS